MPEHNPENPEEERDEDIAARVQGGDTQSFQALVARYEQKMSRYARRFLFEIDDAKDLVQEVFVKAYVNIKGFDTSRRFSPWIYRIAHNEFVNALKKAKKRRTETLPLFDPETLFPNPVASETADGSMKREELRQMFYHSLEKLEPKYREPLVLYYFEEMDYKAIADILQVPVSTVGVRLQRGKAALKKIVKEEL